jgi:Kef-type K+ transport system membrane component KefB
MESLLISLLAIFGGIVIIPPLARRLGLPVIVAELVFGIILGVSFLDIVRSEEPTLEFFASFGLVYLMFLAGLETDFISIFTEGDLGKVLAVSAASLILPFAAGAGISYMADVHPLVLGTIFCTTSIGLILPLLKDLSATRKFSQILVGSVTLVDIFSIFLLAFVLALIEDSIGAEFIYGLLFMVTLLIMPFLISRGNLREKIAMRIVEEAHFDFEIRAAFALIFLLAALSNFLGFHAIVGAFIAGLMVSEVIPKDPVEQKLQSFGYGFFIPLFFILVGSQVNLPVLFSNARDVGILVILIAAALAAKASGVVVVAKLIGLNRTESIALGILHCARLSLIIAVAEVSLELGLIGESIFASLVLLAIISGVVAPALGKRILTKT